MAGTSDRRPLGRRVVAIVCGASSWPHIGLPASLAFSNTARGWQKYLQHELGMNVAPEDLLPLFDSPDSGETQLRTISTFLEERTNGAGFSDGFGMLVFFVYIGHGDLHGRKQEYVLLLQGQGISRKRQAFLRVAEIAETLENVARKSARIVVLDCCFAAEAVSSFQNHQLGVLEGRKVTQAFGENVTTTGVAVLCAASKYDAAKIDRKHRYTLFGNAVLNALWAGRSDGSDWLTLNEICESAKSLLALAHDDPPVPEVHSPVQKNGNLALRPVFPNRIGDVQRQAWFLDPNDKTRDKTRRRCFAAAGVAFGFLLLTGDRVLTQPPRQPPTVSTEQDPEQAGCAADSRIVATATENPGFRLEIEFSRHCSAAWARATRNHDLGPADTLEVVLYREGARGADDAQYRSVFHTYFARTTILRRDTANGRVCAVGAATVGSQRVESPIEVCY